MKQVLVFERRQWQMKTLFKAVRPEGEFLYVRECE